MKRIILTAALGIIIFSCKKEGDATGVTSQGETATLGKLEKDASYAYGISLGQNAERYNQNPQLEDSLNYDEVKRGVQDFLKDSKKLDSYAFGLTTGKQIKGALDNNIIKGRLDEKEIIIGMMDYLNKKKLRVSADSVAVVMDGFYQTQLTRAADNNKKSGVEYLNKVKKEDGAKTTESGIVYKVLQEGSGAKVKEGDRIKVKYKGTTPDGTVFDSTEMNNNGEPVEFILAPGGLIPGWIEGMQLMSKGAKYKLYIPAELGYGVDGSGAIGPNETLIFDIELVDIADVEAPQLNPGQPGVNIQQVQPGQE